MERLLQWAESGWLPDWLIRAGIRRLLAQRIRLIGSDAGCQAEQQRLIDQLRREPVAVETQAANQQHYEVPAEFFRRVLGRRLKYSCGLFETPRSTLDEAEEAMLALSCSRARLQDGQHILELGCGWGSLTLWMAERYPNARITAVSNSHTQRQFIEQQLSQRQLTNVRVLTEDMRTFDTAERFDRIVSVEMFEHMRNYEELFRRLSDWLNPAGLVFIHIFCHRRSTYLFETEGAGNWMGRHFFTGGTMPAVDLFDHFSRHLQVRQQWSVGGQHYARTCEAWLAKLDAAQADLLQLFRQQLPEPQARVTLQRWRMFMMACAELFRYGGGSQWFVSHYLMQPAGKPVAGSSPLDRADATRCPSPVG